MADEAPTSLSRALRLLETLGSPTATRSDGMGVVQLARAIGREKSQVSRTLQALAEAGFVIRDGDTLRYRLGWKVFALAAAAGDQHLLALTPRVLRHLVARVSECAHLSVLDGAGLVTLMSESPPWSIQAVAWTGRQVPLHCTSAGRALLFDHTDSEVRALLQGADFTAGGPNAPSDVADVLRRLHLARRRGYAVVNEEFEAGHVAVAAPVRDALGSVVAALNVSAPKFRLGRSLQTVIAEVRTAAVALSQALAGVEHGTASLSQP